MERDTVTNCLARCAFRAALLMVGASTPLVALTATSSATFNVSATVLPTCLAAATNVAFGNYSGAQLDATSTLSITCTNLAGYTVALDAGTGSGATVASRRMSGPSGQTLTYSLYRDASRLLVWGDTTGTDTLASIGTGGTQSLTVYGRVPGGQYPGAGSYSDTITVTVSY